MKHFIIAILFSLSLSASESVVKFEWAVLYKDKNSEPINISQKRKQKLQKDDSVRFYIKAKSDIFVYLFYIAPDGEISTLMSQKLKTDEEHSMLPNKESWYQFDDIEGTEKFILMVSDNSIKDIDKALENPKNLLWEIKKQRRVHSSLASEKIRAIEIGGVVRGTGSGVKKAQLIEAGKFFTKTYRFEHK